MVGQAVSAEAARPVDRFNPPIGVVLEVADCRCDRWQLDIVEHDQTARTHQLPKVEEIDEHVVKGVAAVHECCVCIEPVADRAKAS